jgi:hydroxymethylbilane synthase
VSQSRLRIGTRGSKLALWQTEFVANRLRERGHNVEVITIRTVGDQIQNMPLPSIGSKGLFTGELEAALADGSVDLAVHSLKDLPTQLAPQFVLGAIPARADARDVLLALEDVSVASLRHGAVVGTSSPRRQGQLLAIRRDLQVQSLRGNVDTRIRKLRQGEADAILLAAAGVERLGLTGLLREHIPPEQVCPCPGQGALAVECRADDIGTREALEFLDHAATRFCVEVERGVLSQLGGGCSIPVGVYCEPRANELGSEGHHIWAAVCSPDGSAIVRVEHFGRDGAEELIAAVAGRLLREGAADILNA